MLRTILLAAALTTAAFVPSAQAAPPYCANVTAGGTSYAGACAVGTYCAVGGGALSHSPLGFAFCVQWP
ncbi:MAG TPA: hypothetical protein VNA20_09135 [Frankiaceae bacterium]|nr:hypothetical protein [Frankiaceae bacterium]